jgi:hypothetical protein
VVLADARSLRSAKLFLKGFPSASTTRVSWLHKSVVAPQGCRGSLNDALLTRLVALNHERATEEKRGLIRHLRPDYQNSNATKAPREDKPPSPAPKHLLLIHNPQSTIHDPQSPAWPER